MEWVCFNGNYLPAGEALFNSRNRSFRYGDGLFETIKVFKGKILLEAFHFDRLFLGMKMLSIKTSLHPADVSKLILELCQKNNCTDSARVRLAVFRNNQNLAEFIIEAVPLSGNTNQWNGKGLRIDLYPYARKCPDAFSNLKTANFLPYVLAEVFARENGIDDALLLNASDFICDSSKANVFLIRKGQIFTPALHQGCIAGTMRRYLLDQLKNEGYRIHQDEISEQQLAEADEVFLTNAIFDLRWVQSFRDRNYRAEESFSIYQKIISALY